MRTTLNFPDALAQAVRERAAAEGRTFTSFLEEAVREHLARHAAPLPDEPLPFYSPRQAGALVDLDDRDAVSAALGHDA